MNQVLKRLLPQKIQLWLAIKRQALRTKLYRRHVMQCQYGGYTFDLYIADKTAEYWYAAGRTEIASKLTLLPEFDFLLRHKLTHGAVVFDAGAHQCVMALILANLVGPEGKVIALEAHPHNAFVGSKNRDLNNMDNLVVLNVAVSDTPGKIRFFPSLNGHVSAGDEEAQAIEVAARSIDDLATEFGPPDVLFIDVEGFETQVLLGAAEVLKTHRPDCFVEVHQSCGLENFGGSAEKVLHFFPEDKYERFVAQPNKSDYIFEHLQSNNLPEKRFFLIAVSRPD